MYPKVLYLKVSIYDESVLVVMLLSNECFILLHSHSFNKRNDNPAYFVLSIQQEHPLFSASVRLCKRWLASQMLWNLITDEALELIVAHLFIAPHPYSPPM